MTKRNLWFVAPRAERVSKVDKARVPRTGVEVNEDRSFLLKAKVRELGVSMNDEAREALWQDKKRETLKEQHAFMRELYAQALRRRLKALSQPIEVI